jgi:hypothetical protein
MGCEYRERCPKVCRTVLLGHEPIVCVDCIESLIAPLDSYSRNERGRIKCQEASS